MSGSGTLRPWAKTFIEGQIDQAARYFKKRALERGVPPRSRLAGIRDHGGGYRVVVSPLLNMRHHVGKGEQLFLLPKVRIAEPVDWDDNARTIQLVERFMTIQTSRGINPCGECRVCCTVPSIKSKDGKLNKPALARCGHSDDAVGCRIHFARPHECRAFECHWLVSQTSNDPMPHTLRPDQCHVMFTEDTLGGDKETFEVHPNRTVEGEHLASPVVVEYINQQQAMGRKAKLVTHYVEGDA